MDHLRRGDVQMKLPSDFGCKRKTQHAQPYQYRAWCFHELLIPRKIWTWQQKKFQDISCRQMTPAAVQI